MSLAEFAFGVYLGIGSVCFASGAMMLIGGEPEDRRPASRAVLLAPVWPLAALVILWRWAEWGRAMRFTLAIEIVRDDPPPQRDTTLDTYVEQGDQPEPREMQLGFRPEAKACDE